MRSQRALDDASQTLINVVIVLAVGFLLMPLFIVVSMSFDSRDYLGRFPPPSLSLQWYASFFTQEYLIKGLKTSLVLASLCAVISTTIGLLAALGIEQCPKRRRDIFTSIFLSPLIVPGVVIGFALLLFYSRLEVSNGFLRLLGGHVLITFPYTVRTSLAALAGIRRSVFEAALSLGATERRVFWTVTLPLAKTGIAAGAVFAFAFSLDDVAVSLFLSGPKSYTLPVALLDMMYANFNLTIAAAAVLFVVATTGLMLLLDRLIGLDKLIGTGNLYRARVR